MLEDHNKTWTLLEKVVNTRLLSMLKLLITVQIMPVNIFS